MELVATPGNSRNGECEGEPLPVCELQRGNHRERYNREGQCHTPPESESECVGRESGGRSIVGRRCIFFRVTRVTDGSGQRCPGANLRHGGDNIVNSHSFFLPPYYT